MKHQAIAVLVALSLATAACATQRAAEPVPKYTVAGIVTAGPVCPVAQNPPDPACADRPVVAAVLLVIDSSGNEAAQVTTGDDGRFEVRLPAGHYTLEPQPVEGLMGTAASVEFDAGPATTPDLEIGYDTGIR